MTENLRAIIQDISYLLNEMSDGNFRIRSKDRERYIGDYNQILLSIRRINYTLSDTSARSTMRRITSPPGRNRLPAEHSACPGGH